MIFVNLIEITFVYEAWAKDKGTAANDRMNTNSSNKQRQNEMTESVKQKDAHTTGTCNEKQNETTRMNKKKPLHSYGRLYTIII